VKPYRSDHPPGRPRVHGYTDAAVREPPSFCRSLARVRASSAMSPHRAQTVSTFDVPVLAPPRRPDGTVGQPVSMTPCRCALALRDMRQARGWPCGSHRRRRAHHALDDAVTLPGMYRELERLRGISARKAVLVKPCIDYLGLGLALEPEAKSAAGTSSSSSAKFYTRGRYGDALAFYEMERERTGEGSAPPCGRGGPAARRARAHDALRAESDPAQRYPAAVARPAGADR